VTVKENKNDTQFLDGIAADPELDTFLPFKKQN